MLSRFIASAAVLFVIGGYVLAGEYTAMISKSDKDGITFTKREKGKKGKGEEVTIKYGKDVKITKGEDKVKADDFAEMVTKAAEGKGKMKGVFAKITTDGEGDKETVSSIEITQRKGKGKDKKDKTDKTDK